MGIDLHFTCGKIIVLFPSSREQATVPALLHLEGFDSHTVPIKERTPPDGGVLSLEQGTGIEPAFTAWEAVVLPIYEPCNLCQYYSRVM